MLIRFGEVAGLVSAGDICRQLLGIDQTVLCQTKLTLGALVAPPCIANRGGQPELCSSKPAFHGFLLSLAQRAFAGLLAGKPQWHGNARFKFTASTIRAGSACRGLQRQSGWLRRPACCGQPGRRGSISPQVDRTGLGLECPRLLKNSLESPKPGRWLTRCSRVREGQRR